MKIELTNLEHSDALSEETPAFRADLVIDGTRIGTVHNTGTGGANAFRGDVDAYYRADEWCRANLPKITMETAEDIDTDLETHTFRLVQDATFANDLRQQMTESVLWHDPADGHLYAATIRTTKADIIAFVKQDHPDVQILNELPFGEALALYRRAADK